MIDRRPSKLLLVLLSVWHVALTNSWIMPLQGGGRSATSLPFSSKNNDDDADAFRDRAAQLRQEIAAYEASRPVTTSVSAVSTPAVTEIPNSVWTLQYRCTAEPSNDEEDAAVTPSFGGTVTVRFRSDGYTDLIEQTGGNPCLTFTKAWGWDVELDREKDALEYVLFSMDATVPSQTDGSSSKSQRFYWQAQLDSQDETLRLVDGTVTVKQDVVQQPSKGGGWFPFLLSPAGILAQFRYVGAFVARPATTTAINVEE